MPTGGYLSGLVPRETAPIKLEFFMEDGRAKIPFMTIDCATFALYSARGERSCRAEMRVLRIARERGLGLSSDMRSNWGMARDIVLISGSSSALARIVADLGLGSRAELLYEEAVELREAVSSEMARLMFCSDEFGHADVLAKCWNPRSEKTQHLCQLLNSGFLRIPLSAFGGRAELTTRDFCQKLERLEQKGGEEKRATSEGAFGKNQ